MLAKEYPKWQSVSSYVRQWRDDGTWPRIPDTLRATMRHKQGRHQHPTAGSLDSQSVKTGITPNGIRGVDAGKGILGRKRHLRVDTWGLVLAVLVSAAAVSDPQGAPLLLCALGGFCKKRRLIWVDGTYRGPLLDWVAARFRFRRQPVLRPAGQQGFRLLPRPWGVAPSGHPTFAWLGLHRRLAKDYQRLPARSEAFIQLAMLRLRLRRLARSYPFQTGS